VEAAGHGAWANVVVNADDSEIATIDRLEQTLGELPQGVVTVRELITRFEICHFKVKEHYRHILESIASLSPAVDPARIGSVHPRQGGDAWMKDTTGRSEVGMRYVLALRSWLGEEVPLDLGGLAEVQELVKASLGEKTDEKTRWVNLLLDRLLDRDLEKHLSAGELSGLKLQLLSCDICHYAFPRNLKQAIRAVGNRQPAVDFEGCGSTNDELTSFARQEFLALSSWLAGEGPEDALDLGERTGTKVWLAACLAKTLKQHVRLDMALPTLGN
jgi:hypothetical protein